MKIFYLPDLGEGLAEAEIRQWYVKNGDNVVVDQPLVSMETAKAVVDVPSPYAGKITQLHGVVNDIVKTGSPLITFETNDDIKDKGSVVGRLDANTSKWQENMVVGSAKAKVASKKAMPAARLLAKEFNIDLSNIQGSGPQGLITVADVKQQQHALGTSLGEGAEKLHGVRRVMAQAMMQSHRDIVPVTIFEDADISHLATDADLSVLLLQAMVAGCKAEPALNAWFDGKTLERKLFSEVNIGLAVDSTEGLFVPVIKQVDSYQANDLRKKIDAYKKSIRERNLASSDMQGASITFSNFGSIAGRYATPIIVPPMVAILACGRLREAAIAREGKIMAGRSLPLSLTFDHRAVTGGEATRFLAAVIGCLQAVV